MAALPRQGGGGIWLPIPARGRGNMAALPPRGGIWLPIPARGRGNMAALPRKLGEGKNG